MYILTNRCVIVVVPGQLYPFLDIHLTREYRENRSRKSTTKAFSQIRECNRKKTKNTHNTSRSHINEPCTFAKITPNYDHDHYIVE